MDSAIQRLNNPGQVNNTMHWMNLYPLDSAIGFPNTYPLDSSFSDGQRYPAFQQLGPERQGNYRAVVSVQQGYPCYGAIDRTEFVIVWIIRTVGNW